MDQNFEKQPQGHIHPVPEQSPVREVPIHTPSVQAEQDKLMEIRHQLNEQDPSKPEFSMKLAKPLFFFSYQFSQGNPAFQTAIFNKIHSLHPEWKMSGEMKDALEKELLDQTLKKTNTHPQSAPEKRTHPSKDMIGNPITKTTVEQDIKDNLRIMRDTLNSSEGEISAAQKDEIDTQLVKYLIKVDHKYLSRTEGRNKKGMSDHYSPHTDSYLSHLVHYALQGHPTGVEIYDQMFSNIRDRVTMGDLRDKKYTKEKFDKYGDFEIDKLELNQVAKILNVHNAHHPFPHYAVKDGRIIEINSPQDKITPLPKVPLINRLQEQVNKFFHRKAA